MPAAPRALSIPGPGGEGRGVLAVPLRKGEGGATLLECLLVLLLGGLLGSLALVGLPLGSTGLLAVAGEFRGSLEQALLRAQAQGRPLRVVLQAEGGAEGSGGPPLRLPRGVRWGLPPGPMPSWPGGMRAPTRAPRTGAAHGAVTVTPRGTMASLWFLTDGQDALCLRLDDGGGVQMYRWRGRPRRWGRL